MNKKLFALYLGGMAKGCHIELHDVMFAVGETYKDTYEQVLEHWFGLKNEVHLDSWMILDVVDGYKVSLSEEKSANNKKLYFINLGAYLPNDFKEHHASTFLVAENEDEVKVRAKQNLLNGYDLVHKDDLYEVDDCLSITEVHGLHVHLTPTNEPENLKPNNNYFVIPQKVVEAYLNKQ
ncbi:DUF1543 domain-containing protein [Zhouia sp. PK063]|uniref:DUF1543 domain-containing protein n=1 Tax=Zhouia sp. PK063 TaxID=3373602 RepID=UPI0037B34CA4